MIETIDGNTVVKCDCCGERIYDGWMPQERRGDGFYIDESKHYCDECAQEIKGRCEFRTCMVCGKPMVEGFTDEGNGMGASFHACEDCFEEAMCNEFGEWRKKDDEGYNGGYYDAYEPRECTWYDTGVYWTEWY